MDTARWPQEIVMKPMKEIVQNSKPSTSSSSSAAERKIRPQKDKALNCPRCNSTNTKFCYYNNYSLSQPRYFCKTCRRYWTAGGTLRNIPVGGGSKKNKRSSSSSSSSSKNISKPNHDLVLPPIPIPIPPPSPIQNPKIHEAHDLNLGFHEFKTFTELIQVPNYDQHVSSNNNNDKENMPCSSSELELLTAGFTSRGLNSYAPMSVGDPNAIYSSGFSSLPDLKSSLNFSWDGLGFGTSGGLQESSTNGSRLLFPFEDLKAVSNGTVATSTTTTTTTTVTDAVQQQNIDQSASDSNGYWSGVMPF